MASGPVSLAAGPRRVKARRKPPRAWPGKIRGDMLLGRAGLLAAVLSLAGLRPAPPAASGETLTLAVRADITVLFPNPPLLNEVYSLEVNGNVFEGLVRFDRNHNLEPALAERWESPDSHTTVFTLKPGVRFSDGRPLTA